MVTRSPQPALTALLSAPRSHVSAGFGIPTCRVPPFLSSWRVRYRVREVLRLLPDPRDQVLDEVVLEAVFADALGDATDGVEHGGVVAAEAVADARERLIRELA